MARKQLLHQGVEAFQRRRPPDGREGQIDEQDREGQVNAARDDGVDGPVGDVELEERPAERQDPEEPADRAAGGTGLAFALTQLGQRFEVDGFVRRLVTVGGIHGFVWPLACAMGVLLRKVARGRGSPPAPSRLSGPARAGEAYIKPFSL